MGTFSVISMLMIWQNPMWYKTQLCGEGEGDGRNIIGKEQKTDKDKEIDRYIDR